MIHVGMADARGAPRADIDLAMKRGGNLECRVSLGRPSPSVHQAGRIAWAQETPAEIARLGAFIVKFCSRPRSRTYRPGLRLLWLVRNCLLASPLHHLRPRAT